MISNRMRKNIGLYFISNISSRLLQFIIIPIYSIYLTTEEFGYFNLVLSVLAFTTPLCFQSLWEGVLRFTIENKNDKKAVCKIINNVFSYYFLLISLYLICFLISKGLVNIMFFNLIFMIGILQPLFQLYLFISRSLSKNKVFAFANVLFVLLNLSLNLILILVFDQTIYALFISNTFALVASIIFIEFKIRIFKNFQLGIDFVFLKSLLNYSIPLAINALSWWVISSGNNIIISTKLDLSQNGIYSMISRFGIILSIFSSIFNSAWLEESFHLKEEGGINEKFSKIYFDLSKLVPSSLFFIYIIIYIFYNLFIDLKYMSGLDVLNYILMAVSFSILSAHLGSFFLTEKNSKLLFRTTFIAAVIGITMSYILTPLFGINGAAFCFMISYVIMYIVRLPKINHSIPNFNFNIIFLTINSILFLSWTFLIDLSNYLQLVISIILSMIYFIMVNFRLLKNIASLIQKKI